MIDGGTMDIRAVICDMDGVLFDTENLAVDCWIKAAAGFGYDLPRQAVIDTIGIDARGSKPILSAYLPAGFDYDATRRIKTELMAEFIRARGVPVKDGVREFLAAAKQRGYPMAVATSTERSSALMRLKSAGFDKLFDRLVFSQDVKRGKPAPDIFLLAAQKLGVPPENCLAVEDSPAGLEAAKAAGMTTVHVPDLMQPNERMKENSDHIFSSIRDAISLL